eukprot:snap_masked-scaffold_111-processed-gene-0.9-mRNA-1 protein AED:1.00 eAED:1.00 QI:0/0/0/0/1/1/2/0/83
MSDESKSLSQMAKESHNSPIRSLKTIFQVFVATLHLDSFINNPLMKFSSNTQQSYLKGKLKDTLCWVVYQSSFAISNKIPQEI